MSRDSQSLSAKSSTKIPGSCRNMRVPVSGGLYGISDGKKRAGAELGMRVKKAAEGIGYPVVLKVCSPEVSHKTESGLVAVDLRNEADLEAAFKRISAASPVKDTDFLVQEMVKGGRELVMGMIRDPQFGPCVMFGLGGIFTEILGDVTFRAGAALRVGRSKR